MSQQIYLDDCACSKRLAVTLRAAGHVVVTPADAGISKQPDPVHLQYAASQGLVLLTKNPQDFADLHRADPQHAGIVVVHQDNDPDRDMSLADIARAIANLENAGLEFRGNYHVLNSWHY